MIKGTTKSGFHYLIPEKRVNNYNLLEAINDADENPMLIPKVLKLLLGDEQTEKFKKHLTDKEGFISMEKMMDELKDIFTTQSKLKKS